MVEADRVAATVAQGVHGRRRAGMGETFWQFRQYQPGDRRAIDWRQSAPALADICSSASRNGRRPRASALWCDISRVDGLSLARRAGRRSGSGPTCCRWRSASLLVRGGERVAAARRRRAQPCRAGRADLAGRDHARRRRAALPPPDHSLPRHARAVLIGDFLAPLPEIQPRVGGAGRLAGARPYPPGAGPGGGDAGRGNRAYAGRVLFEWGDTGRRGQAILVPRVEEARPVYVERLRHHREGIAAIAAAAGWGFMTHHVDQPPQTALLALWQALAPQ